MARPLLFRDLIEDLLKDLPSDAHKQAYCILYTGQMFKHHPASIEFRPC